MAKSNRRKKQDRARADAKRALERRRQDRVEQDRLAQRRLELIRDPATPSELGILLAEGIPGATFTLIEDVAHLANVAEPGQFSHAVLTHLEDS